MIGDNAHQIIAKSHSHWCNVCEIQVKVSRVDDGYVDGLPKIIGGIIG